MKPQGLDLPDIDAIDRRILIELQADGRMTNVELARRAGISAPPCLRRVRRLEEAGIIRGYHADTDPQKLGFSITFFVVVGLDSQKEAALAAFEGLVAAWRPPRGAQEHGTSGQAPAAARPVPLTIDREALSASLPEGFGRILNPWPVWEAVGRLDERATQSPGLLQGAPREVLEILDAYRGR